jgi:hypothetical protein
VTAAPTEPDSALERAERIVERFEDDARRLVRSAVARAVEVAEDVWAEARSVHDRAPSED